MYTTKMLKNEAYSASMHSDDLRRAWLFQAADAGGARLGVILMISFELISVIWCGADASFGCFAASEAWCRGALTAAHIIVSSIREGKICSISEMHYQGIFSSIFQISSPCPTKAVPKIST